MATHTSVPMSPSDPPQSSPTKLSLKEALGKVNTWEEEMERANEDGITKGIKLGLATLSKTGVTPSDK